MKKWKVVLSLLVILTLVGSTGFAAAGNKKITISMDGKKYSVKEVPVVMDGQSVHSDIPTFIHPVNDYTLVPIRFIAEHYGAKVGWEQKTKTATISLNDKEIKLTINSKDVYINGEKKVLDGGVVPKLVTFDNKDSRTMVPLRFISETFGYEVGWDNTNRVPFINTSSDNDIEEDVAANKVEKITREEINGKEALVVNNTDKVEVKVIKLKNPERVVIDLLDSSLQGGKYFDYNYDFGFVKGVRVSQFVPDQLYKPSDKIVRIVLDVKDGVTDPNIKVDTYDNNIVITPEKSFWEGVNYSLDGSTRVVTINAKEETDYHIDYDSSGKAMAISIPSKNTDLSKGSVNIRDGLINDITVNETGEQTKVVLNFRRGVEYTVLSKDIDNKITISLKRDASIKLSDMLVVIDAGHGGKDPGAVSSNGTREKDINLNVSLKLNEGLKEKGYSTLMTRDKDTFIDLYERARIANDNQADIFVSVHSNSHNNKAIDGIQVLYCPAGKGKVKQEDNHPLAKMIMDELLEGTEAKDRGIIQRPNLVVLKETAMPATLIELGFLSNPAEEKLIKDENYQDILVESIIKGIEKYFEIY